MKSFLLCPLFFSLLTFSFAQSGMLDPSFGNRGVISTDMGSPEYYGSAARQVLIDSAGGLYVLIDLGFITKRLQNGSIDSSYGTHGSSSSVLFRDSYAALQPDGKILIAGGDNNNSNEYNITRLNANGMPDPAFGNNGVRGIGVIPSAVTIQSDGKVIVAGNFENSFAVARMNGDGSQDNSFNGGNISITQLENNTMVAKTVAIQADGRIVVGGGAFSEVSGFNFAMVRYNINGLPDSTFDNDGILTTAVGNGSAIGYSVAIQSDQKIVLAGYTIDSSHFALARYNIDGGLDTSFNGNGKQTADLGADMQIGNAVAIQTDNKIVVAGNTLDGDYNDFAVVRFNTDGSPDSSFDQDGVLTTDIDSSDDYAGSVVIQSDGKIVVAGYAYTDNLSGFILTRYSANGKLDNSFDDDGKLAGDNKNGNTRFNTTAIQTDGKIIAAGRTFNGTNDDFAIVRYNRNGGLDSTFGDDGKQIVDFGEMEEATGVVIQTDGKIIVAGNSGNSSSELRIVIARYNTDGRPDNTFNGNGKLITSVGYAVFCKSVALQDDGKILLAGVTYTDPNYDSAYFLIARFNTYGTFDSTFGNGGKQLTDFETSLNFASSLAITRSGKIVVAGRSHLNGQDNFALASYNSDGSPDTSFSHDGKQNNVFGPENYFGESLAIQKDGKIVVAGFSETISAIGSSFVVARYLVNGDLDTTFSEDGFETTHVGPHFNFGTSVSIKDDGRIAVGGTDDNFAMVLYKKNGSPDSTFGNNGIQITQIGAGSSSIQSMAFVDNTLYAAGYGQYPGTGVVARYLIAEGGPPASGYITAANGNWNAPGTWIGGIIPDETSEVTVKHNVTITTNSMCYSLKIESPGGNLTVYTGANLTIAH